MKESREISIFHNIDGTDEYLSAIDPRCVRNDVLYRPWKNGERFSMKDEALRGGHLEESTARWMRKYLLSIEEDGGEKKRTLSWSPRTQPSMLRKKEERIAVSRSLWHGGTTSLFNFIMD